MPGCSFSSSMRPRVLGYRRSPFTKIGGALGAVPISAVAGAVVDAALECSGVSPDAISAVVVGQCLSAFCRQHAAQQVVTNSVLRVSSPPAVSINVVCNSGLEAFIDACRRICVGEGAAYVVAGMENMTRAHTVRCDGAEGSAAVYDGLQDASSQRYMGDIAEEYYAGRGYTRDQLDGVAIRSCEAALSWSRPEIVALEISTADNTVVAASHVVDSRHATRRTLSNTAHPSTDKILAEKDDQLLRYNPKKLVALKPCFCSSGMLTSGTASAKSDGAAALVLTEPNYQGRSTHEPVAEVLGYFYLAVASSEYIRAPVDAANSLCRLLNLPKDRITCIQVTEAFAGIVLDMQAAFPTATINKHGDALACGHPLAASSCRIIGDLAYALEPGQIGIACACNGGGGGYAICLQRLRQELS